MSVQSSPVGTAASATTPKKGLSLSALATNQLTILLLVFVALFFYFGSQNVRFFRTGEISSLVVDFSGLVLLAIAETFVIVSGGIDLSVGSTVAIAGLSLIHI